MSNAMEAFGMRNPSPSSTLCLKRGGCAALFTSPPTSLRIGSLVRPQSCRAVVSPTGLGLGLLVPLHPRNLRNRLVFSSFAAAHEESKPSEIEGEEEKIDVKVGAEESEEAWKQTLASFKEQALKMQNVSQEAYEVYSKKAMVILKETSEKLKIQADKAREDLSVIAKELSEEGKVYLSTAAENSPEPVKDIVETFAASSPDDLKDVSKVLDFYVGIPYGGLLCLGGFLSFMITGSISAIRFGVILGGTLLALSISSLKSWKRGESSLLAVKGQAAIATILFLRELRLLFTRPAFTSIFAVLISGAAVAFYIYRIAFYGGQTTGKNFETDTEN